MSCPLQQLDIFELRPLITNFSCKLSTITEYDARKQLLCLVSEENDIVLRYTSDGGQEVLKLISWFRRTSRVVHDVCFDPRGTWLLVLCFDNTLHIVPALAVVDKTYAEPSSSGTYPQQRFSTTQVTSYIIPFVGPHECPDSKRCPNQAADGRNGERAKDDAVTTTTTATARAESAKPRRGEGSPSSPADVGGERAVRETAEKLEGMRLSDENPGRPVDALEEEDVVIEPALSASEQCNMDAFSHDVPSEMLAGTAPPNQTEDKTGNSQVMSMSFMASNTCPYPLSVVWWQTLDGTNRAVIGYSDGSICFVGLSPNCPFVASTAIESGSVVKLLICRDNTFDSVMLLITSSLKQQFKLLLEQKAIKYVYPGEISPTTAQARESDWQIVMPLKSGSNCSDPVSEASQLDEDVFVKSGEVPTAAASDVSVSEIANPSSVQVDPPLPSNSAVAADQLPPQPPPSYAVAISRQMEGVSTVPQTATATTTTTTTTTSTTTGVRFQQQQLPDLDDPQGRAGILPAARARLASLKSLGSKKLNAIRMRLSDNRQKLEEYIPENTLGSFAIMDSPSLTPELLSNSIGSFYTIQNLRSTYLLSALHSQSNSLSVHSIDISLKPLFLYKIPPDCLDILISSNILYAIQYVDINETPAAEAVPEESNSEKENRDTDVEKEERQADDKRLEVVDLSEDDDKLMLDASATESAADTSATTSGGCSNVCSTPSNSINAVGVISSAMASLRAGDEDRFNATSQLGLFRFEHETVLNLYQMATYRLGAPDESLSKDEKAKAFEYREIRSPMDYVTFYESADVQEEYSLRQMEIMQNEFPKINYDPCYVITNKNVYYIQLKKEPFAIFLEAALAGEWTQCREFCNTFDLNYETCIEFAGDYLLRRKKVTQALLTYNTARIKPIRTALKLAMFGQTTALMHLCAMALKATYILKSKHFSHPILKTMLSDITYRHSEDVRLILPPTPASYGPELVNEGAPCSDYAYGVDESISNLQMSPSSQFHLANLLVITLAEKAVNDKNYMPLWNFLVMNGKYHTNMTSIVLCQSGLFSAALVLAKVRGVCIDTFLALTSVVGQEFGWYTELNVCLYNLSEPMFAETITYLPHIAVDYFAFIQEKLPLIRPSVLRRLQQQLDPFSATLRPIMSHTSSTRLEHYLNDNNTYILGFCRSLVETYLAVLIHMESQCSKRDRITNALNAFRLTYEDNQFAIESARFKPISAGCAHCACVVDGVAYFWGSNGVPCYYSTNKSSDPPEPPHAVKSLDLLSQLNLEVHAVKCGRQHTLVLTNNGLYSLGNNNLAQLGIGGHMQVSMQPMLVRALDGKNITILEAGQYHNAAVADGLLYTWGWGVYGQLGHGNTENVDEPKVVKFFKYKKVLQVSLGHAHSLVLCQGQSDGTDLYVFGSNHFGQLGLGTGRPEADGARAAEDETSCATQVKWLVPQRLEVSTARIRLIHTKFFSNLVVDEEERMYTWGSSPQALRLANQIKRRANAKQKIEENQRREISKRFEATLGESVANAPVSDIAEGAAATAATAPIPPIAAIADVSVANDEEKGVDGGAANEEAPLPLKDAFVDAAATSLSIELIDDVVDEIVVPAMKPLGTSAPEILAPVDPRDLSAEKKAQQRPFLTTAASDVDPCEHMSPHLVDTSEVAGQILQISSGLFHFALISSSCTLYTWGKNLEHQLGTEDKERRAVNKPSPIDNIERPMYVDCGADFTLVMTTEYVVKAFGGNSNGQCGRDLGATIDKMKQRVVCLPTTKRLMRFESQCVEVPVEINLPRPRIRLDTEPVRYLKSIPRFQAHFVQEADINFDDGADYDRPSSSQQYRSTTQANSSENVITGQESDDVISSLENLSNNDLSSLQLSQAVAEQDFDANQNQSTYECTPDEQSYARLPNTDNASVAATECNCSHQLLVDDRVKAPADDLRGLGRSEEASEEEMHSLRHYIHYCLYIFHGLYDPEKVRDFSKERLEYRIRTLMLNFKFVDAFTLCLQDCSSAASALKIFEYFAKDTGYVPLRRTDLRFLIYYLFLHFIRHKYDLLDCERFFLGDLDYYLLELAYVLYFNNNNTVLEQNLNEKFKVLFGQSGGGGGGGGGTGSGVASVQDSNQNDSQLTHKLEDTDAIFDSLSVKFKTIVCQRLLKHCNN